MKQIPFVGGAYEARSPDVTSQRCVNLYPTIDKEGGKNELYLQGTPGLVEWCDTGTSARVRNVKKMGNYLYAVVGDTLYRITTAAVATSLGTLNSSTGYVWIEHNGTQVMVVDGTKGYIYNSSTGAFAEIADADFPGAASLTFQDGYFIVNNPSTGQFWISGSYDGTTWDATDYATAEGWPDDVTTVLSDHRELWLFGEDTTEVWYDSGNATFPFERKIDEIIERGIGAAATACQLDNTVFWVDDERKAIRADGYTPVTVSTRQIEYQWSTYSTIADAVGFAYSQAGHTFYVVTFPTADKTWVYDAATGFWHERMSSFDYTDGRWRGNCYEYFNGKHLVGDHSNGKIYELDFDTYTEDGHIFKAIRTSQPIHSERQRLRHHAVDLDIQSGVGDTTTEDPQIMLKWSDNGGRTWSNEHWRSMGKVGEYGQRAVWRRLGQSRNRVYQVEITDPVPRVILGAYAEISGGRA